MGNVVIPIPPLEIQNEIVKILDVFKNMEAELEAELEARKKQFEYYLNEIFNFKFHQTSVEFKTLEEIGIEFFRGSGITKNQLSTHGFPCIRYGEIYTKFNFHFNECQSHVNESTLTSKKYFEYGDILFAITGEKIEDIAKAIAYTGKERCLAGGDIVVMKHNQNPKYISYALSTNNLIKQKIKGKIKSKVVHASLSDIKNLIIPIPPIDIQNQIADFLDRFNILCNDLTAGLPAEIEARRKQYEYYRDKLLSFKELEN